MKKLNLLLATTAILTAGAFVVNATDTNISGNAAQLQASVKFMEPVTIAQSQALHFGTLIHPTAGQTVVWVPYNSTTEVDAESTAQQAFTSGAQAPKVGIMTYTGPDLTLTNEGDFILSLSSTASGAQDISATISLTSGSGESAKTCGSVHFDGSYVKMPDNQYKVLHNGDSIYVGGRFTVDENYDNSISYGDCTGSVYVTLVVVN